MRVAIIGAGVVGLACARELALAGHEIYILEANVRIAEGVTSRNSGVIHSPLNYPAGSLKAQMCFRGRELLYEWCGKKGVPHLQTGKLIVATSEAESEELLSIQKAAHLNGATEVELIGKVRLNELESATLGVEALFSPRTGIVDPYEFSRSLLQCAEEHGASLALSARVTGVSTKSIGFELETTLGEISCDAVVNSAGLMADEIAALRKSHSQRIYPWRGDYFTFKPGSRANFKRLIYPVKMKSDPGLGVHLTIDLQGKYRLGPDVELVHVKDDFSPREDKAAKFLLATKKLFPWATAEMLSYDTCGIRPKLRSPSDKTEKDFVIESDGSGWIDLLGIESPGLTSSMAIAERVGAILTGRM